MQDHLAWLLMHPMPEAWQEKWFQEEQAMHHLHMQTPLVESLPLAQKVHGRVWLKMESLQPSGSFKLRGVGHACQVYRSRGAARFISSSGGNAGIAVAYAGRKLGAPVAVVVPESTSKRAMEVIRNEGATVVIKGRSWIDAHQHAKKLVDPTSALIHPFDDPLIWAGHASLLDEIKQSNLRPDAVVLSVGGGGLLCGIIQGLHAHGMGDVPVLAVETLGADSLSASLRAGHHIRLERIESIATTLGAVKVAEKAYEWCQRHPVVSHVVSDQDAIDACLRFSTDHRLLVEPACGAALAALYRPAPALIDKKDVLVIVCGGVGVTIDQLLAWKQQVGD